MVTWFPWNYKNLRKQKRFVKIKKQLRNGHWTLYTKYDENCVFQESKQKLRKTWASNENGRQHFPYFLTSLFTTPKKPNMWAAGCARGVVLPYLKVASSPIFQTKSCLVFYSTENIWKPLTKGWSKWNIAFYAPERKFPFHWVPFPGKPSVRHLLTLPLSPKDNASSMAFPYPIICNYLANMPGWIESHAVPSQEYIHINIYLSFFPFN